MYKVLFVSILAVPCVLSVPLHSLPESKQSYLKARQDFLNAEEKMKIGENITFTTKEKRVNAILMEKKVAEITRSRHGAPFPPSIHFFQGKKLIENSTVFKIIRKIPKGKYQRAYCKNR